MRIGLTAAIIYVAMYAASVFYLTQNHIFTFNDLLPVFAIAGVGFSFVAWLFTLGAKPIPISLSLPGAQAFVAVLLVAVVAAYLVWGSPFVMGDAATDKSSFAYQAVALTSKLLVFVIFPFVIFQSFFKSTWSDFGLSREAWLRLLGRDGLAAIALGGAICVFQYFVGQAAEPIRSGAIAGNTLWLGLPLAFAWLMLEVGLVEEFFFHGLLQSRLAALFKSEWAGTICHGTAVWTDACAGNDFAWSRRYRRFGNAPFGLDRGCFNDCVAILCFAVRRYFLDAHAQSSSSDDCSCGR